MHAGDDLRDCGACCDGVPAAQAPTHQEAIHREQECHATDVSATGYDRAVRDHDRELLQHERVRNGKRLCCIKKLRVMT